MAAASSVVRRYLTKSLFQKACGCPRKLVYAVHPDFSAKDTDGGFLQNLANEGKKIGAYSCLLFPDGVHVGGSMDEVVEQTRSLLDSHDKITLFEAAVQWGPCLIRADILHKTSSTQMHLMEVKAKSWDSRNGSMVGKRGGIKADFLPYIRDVAFQKWVVSNAYPDCTLSSFLVMPDKAKVNTQVPNLNGLFIKNDTEIWLDEASQQMIVEANELLLTEVNVDDLVDSVLNSELSFPGSHGQSFEQVIEEFADILENFNHYLESIPPPVGNQCKDCEFRSSTEDPSGFEMCWNKATGMTTQEQQNLVIDMYHGGRTTEKLLASKKYRMCDVLPQDLGLTADGKNAKKKKDEQGMSRAERQWYQVRNTDSEVVLDRDFLLSEMETWRYPLHFVDFETISPALPYTINKRPYETLAFQFSHHRLDQDGNVEHVSEFLCTTPGKCPNQSFLGALADTLSDCSGTVFRWGAHENTVLSALLQDYGPDKHFLESLLTGGECAMVDLMRVVTKGYYVAGSGASSSIKNLLLPTMKVSRNLKEIYGNPTYTSSNFTDMQWWRNDPDTGEPCDPYSLLKAFEGDNSVVSHGGDAIVAYQVLQSSNLRPEIRSSIEASLLRYCELDTLAMVMIVQGLQGLLLDDAG